MTKFKYFCSKIKCMFKIIAIIGARPQFIKHAPVEIELSKDFNLITIHTGQHYDINMSKVFFDELKIKKPQYTLNLGGMSHGKQTGLMMVEIEDIVLEEKPDGILVYGDTNSTLAGALVGAKLHIPVFHIEAGLRSYNKDMPEEVNRVLTDHVSDLFFIPSNIARENLEKENIKHNVFNAGDVMFDMIKIAQSKGFLNEGIEYPYYYITLHRPYNVDEKERLKLLLETINSLDKKAIFSTHPRTKNKMMGFEMNFDRYPNIKFIDPVSYFDNINLIYNSDGLITDSGGMQKEAYWLKKKCITVRPETEWLETLENKWNSLVFDKPERIIDLIQQIPGLYNEEAYGKGNASYNIRIEILKYLNNKI